MNNPQESQANPYSLQESHANPLDLQATQANPLNPCNPQESHANPNNSHSPYNPQESHANPHISQAEFADLLISRAELSATVLEALCEYDGIGLFQLDLATGSIAINPTIAKLTGFAPGEIPEDTTTRIDLTHEDDRVMVGEAMRRLASGEDDRYYLEYRMRRRDGSVVAVAESALVCERDSEGRPVKVAGLAHDLTRLKWAEEKARNMEQENRLLTQNLSESVLEEQNRLLRACNVAARMIIGGFHTDYETLLRQTLQVFGESVSATRVAVWRNVPGEAGGYSFFLRSYWSEQAISAQPERAEYSYDLVVPEWQTRLAEGTINILGTSLLEPELQELFQAEPGHQFFYAPLYLNGEFWGMLSMESATRTKPFFEEEVSILLLGNMVMASSISRHEQLAKINEAREQALASTRAKGEFLSRMSHEIRTPMNAVVGMTTIARKSNDPERITYCLEKIEESSRQLLSLINDILDMSKIDSGKFEIVTDSFDFERMVAHVVSVADVKLAEKDQRLECLVPSGLTHELMGDELRLSQVLINLLNNAVKFTPVSGHITLLLELREPSELREVNGQSDPDKLRELDGQSEPGGGNQCGQSSEPAQHAGQGKHAEPAQQGRPDKPHELAQQGGSDKQTEPAQHAGPGTRRYLLHGEVRDTGIGISPAQQQRLFQSFEQADGSITRAYGGTGLGLAICKSIIELMGGRIWVESELDQGARFIFEVDIAQSERTVKPWGQVKASTAEGEERDWGAYTILLAEDIEINREIAHSLLEDTGLTIVDAVDGVEAVRIFSEEPERYHLVMMDLQMPRLDGLSATEQIRALNNTWARRVPIIAMTANAFKEDVEQCLAAGMNDHLAKPFVLSALLELMSQYLDA